MRRSTCRTEQLDFEVNVCWNGALKLQKVFYKGVSLIVPALSGKPTRKQIGNRDLDSKSWPTRSQPRGQNFDGGKFAGAGAAAFCTKIVPPDSEFQLGIQHYNKAPQRGSRFESMQALEWRHSSMRPAASNLARNRPYGK